MSENITDDKWSEFYFEDLAVRCTHCGKLMNGCKVLNANITTMELNFHKIDKFCILCDKQVIFV